jgi:hypothetical protein
MKMKQRSSQNEKKNMKRSPAIFDVVVFLVLAFILGFSYHRTKTTTLTTTTRTRTTTKA